MLFLYDSTNRIQIPEKIYPSQIQKCRWRIVFYSTLSQFSNDILTLAPKQNLLFHIPLQIVINLPFRSQIQKCRWRIVFYSTLSQFSNDILTLAPKQNLLFHIPLQIVINLPFRNTAVFCHKFHRLFFTAALR